MRDAAAAKTGVALTPEELAQLDALSNQELLMAYKENGDERYKWPLVLRYEGLIKNAALQISGVYSHFAQVDDIISEGVITLLSAIDRFDPDKGVKFETFISKRIRGMVIDMARKQDWLPRNLRRRTREFDDTISELRGTLGRYPSESEVAEKLGISVERYQKESASVALGNILSLDALMDVRDGDSTGVDIPSRVMWEQPEAAYQERELQEVLAQGIASLKENEQLVLSLYYEKNLHMKEIAQVMEISPPRVSQIHSRAIEKLQVHMRDYISGSDSPKTGKGRRK